MADKKKEHEHDLVPTNAAWSFEADGKTYCIIRFICVEDDCDYKTSECVEAHEI